MIGHEILSSFCVNYFECELMKEENPPEQSRLGIFLAKIYFRADLNAFIGEDEQSILLKKLSHRSGNFGKILYEPSVETGMIEKTLNTLNGGGMRIDIP
ncbi:hypothetical protein Tco_0036783 [Tanacetum coccineum]